MSRFLSTMIQPLKYVSQTLQSVSPSIALVKSEVPLYTSIRTKVRCNFPRPNEVKRVRVHGWTKRMATVSGRKIIMRGILRGRYVLCH